MPKQQVRPPPHEAIAISAPDTPPRPPKPLKDGGNVKAIVNAILILVALFLTVDLLRGKHHHVQFSLGRSRPHLPAPDTPLLNCVRRVRLHNAFASLCRPYQPGPVYSARFGGLGGWELEALHSGDFGDTFHVFDSTPLVSEKQAGIQYHDVGLGPAEESVTLASPSRVEHPYSILPNFKPGHKTSGGKKILNARVERLRTLMNRLGHPRLAILRMDLGGLEFAVIESWQRERIKLPIDQIVVRFSTGPFKEKSDTHLLIDAIRRMGKLGFRLVDRVETECNFARVRAVDEKFWVQWGKRNMNSRRHGNGDEGS